MIRSGGTLEVDDAPLDHCFTCQTTHIRVYKSLPNSDKEIYIAMCLDEKKCGARFLIDKEMHPNIITKL